MIVGIANAISKPGVFRQVSIAGQLFKLRQFQAKVEGDRLLPLRALPRLCAPSCWPAQPPPPECQPRVEAVRLFHPLLQDGMSALHKELAQIPVPAPLGISQRLLATGEVFSRYHA